MKSIVYPLGGRTLGVALIWIGTLLSSHAQTPVLTITNPTPAIADLFGQAVATVGDRLLVGDPQDSTGDQYTGAVYLFNANGQLVRTFLNPAPANGSGCQSPRWGLTKC